MLEKGEPYTHRSNAVAVIAFLMGFAELAEPRAPGSCWARWFG